MNKLLKVSMIVAAFVMIALSSSAKTMRQVWKTMPDSLVPTIDHVRRVEMLDLIDYRVRAEVDNRYGSHSIMDTLTASYLHCQVSKQSDLAMRLLPTTDGDTIVCMVNTYRAPVAESTIRFYDLGWHQLSASQFLPFDQPSDIADSLCFKPDTMPQQRFDELCHSIVAILVSATTSPSNSDIVLSAAVPLTSADNKDAMASLFRSRQLRWNGTRYVYHYPQSK